MLDFKKYLIEMPRLIPKLSVSDNLDIYNTNKAKYNELLKAHKEEYYKYDDNHIVYFSNNRYFCLDYVRKEVTYYMEYATSYDKLLGSFLWQSLVWRSDHVEYNKTLPHEIFFKKLLPKYGTIATDVDQTSDGKRFWSYQIKYALDTNLNVYYYDMISKDFINIDTMLKLDFLIQKYHIWGHTKAHQKKLIVISNKVLPVEHKLEHNI